MIEIGMHKIYKNFGYKQVLKDINFEILTGDRVGIVGKNGSGKSTLFKMIMKKEFPDTGNITIRKQATIGYLEQIPTISDNDITVKDMLMSSFFEIHAIEQRMRALEQDMMHNNVDEAILNKYAKIQYIALGGYEVEEKLNKVITGFKLHSILDKPFAILSGGQKTIINLAQLILTEPDILLLDEPTNHLDLDSIRWLENFLLNFKNTVIVVSHDRYFLNKVCTHIADIDYSRIQLYVGNYDFWYEYSQLQLQQAKEVNKKAEAKKKELEEFIARFSANASKAKQATSRKKLLDNLEMVDIKPSLRRYPFIAFKPGREVGNIVLKVEGLSKTVDGIKLLNNVSFSINPKEKVAFVGDVKATETFFKIIMGERNFPMGSNDVTIIFS